MKDTPWFNERYTVSLSVYSSKMKYYKNTIKIWKILKVNEILSNDVTHKKTPWISVAQINRNFQVQVPGNTVQSHDRRVFTQSFNKGKDEDEPYVYLCLFWRLFPVNHRNAGLSRHAQFTSTPKWFLTQCLRYITARNSSDQ